jgi:hypothetical protein
MGVGRPGPGSGGKAIIRSAAGKKGATDGRSGSWWWWMVRWTGGGAELRIRQLAAAHAGRRSSSVGSANFAVHGEDNGDAYSHGHEAAWEASSDAQGWWWVGAWNEPAQQLTRFHAKLVTNALLA